MAPPVTGWPLDTGELAEGGTVSAVKMSDVPGVVMKGY